MSEATRSWPHVQALGLFPMVHSLEVYKELSASGIADGLRYFRENPIKTPQIGHYRIAHKLAFDYIHPWAGSIRKPGDEVSIGGLPGCISGSLPFDIALHDAQCKEIAVGSDNPLLLAAFSHVRASRMHPFIDGNGRSTRVVCDAMLREIVGPKQKIAAWGPEYKAALVHAEKTNDFGPFMRALAQRSPQKLADLAPAGKCMSPFDLTPGFYTKSEAAKGVVATLDSTRVKGGTPLASSEEGDYSLAAGNTTRTVRTSNKTKPMVAAR